MVCCRKIFGNNSRIDKRFCKKGSYLVWKGETFVCFIRKKENPNKSYITCEVSKRGTIKQFKLAFNRPVTSEEDLEFKKKYQEYLKGV